MPRIDHGLAAREQQLVEAYDLLVAKHGAQSETVALIRERLETVRAEIKDSNVDHSAQESVTSNMVEHMGGPRVKDSAVMFVILGVVLIFAFGGMSTMFMMMLAANW